MPVTASLGVNKPPESDGDLLVRVGAHDVTALDALYDRYAGYVYALSWRVLREPRDAEEVVQDIFWQLWEGRIRYDPTRGRFSTWLQTVARNRSIDRRRRRQVAERGAVRQEDAPEPHHHQTPETDAQHADRRQAVQQALSQLSDDQQQALELCFYDGLSHREVAVRLDAPLGTVKSRIRAALARLKTALGPLT